MRVEKPILQTCLVVLIAVVLLSSIGLSEDNNQQGAVSGLDASRSAEEDNVREAVFRYLFDHNGSGAQKQAAAFCISVGNDPADDFIKRFDGHKPPVQKASLCRILRDSSVVDKRTGKGSLIFRVSNIKWISESEVVADAGYYEGNRSASAERYRIFKKDGAWAVSERMTGWVI